MTITSLNQLAAFLNKYNMHGRVADYGGSGSIGGGIVSTMLDLKDVRVKNSKVGTIDVVVSGTEKKKKPVYFPLDYENGVDLMKKISGKKFDGGICMDLLEHVENPFIVAENISRSLVRGALLFVTVPWIWELHYHPKDYWRFAPQGLEELFKKDMKKLSIEIVRDQSDDEGVPRARLVGVFKKK